MVVPVDDPLRVLYSWTLFEDVESVVYEIDYSTLPPGRVFEYHVFDVNASQRIDVLYQELADVKNLAMGTSTSSTGFTFVLVGPLRLWAVSSVTIRPRVPCVQRRVSWSACECFPSRCHEAMSKRSSFLALRATA